MKKVASLFLIVTVPTIATFVPTFAYSQTQELSYPDNTIIDSDLDGLTDEGEKQLFGTDEKNPDSDSDGWYDGTEIIANTNPLDATTPSATTIVTTDTVSKEIPWSWYITRASGLIAFAFAWIVIFLGIAIRLPLLQRFIRPVYSLSAHFVLALHTILFSLLHGVSMLFDKFFRLSFADILIPFHTTALDPFALSFGILGMYGLLLISMTSYFKPMIPFKLWRAMHFLNVIVYTMIIAHALLLGTDLAHPIARSLFISANVLLGVLLIWNLSLKFFHYFQAKKQVIVAN